MFEFCNQTGKDKRWMMKWWFNRVRGDEIIDKRREHQARNDHFYMVGKMVAKYICTKYKESLPDFTKKENLNIHCDGHWNVPIAKIQIEK